MAGGGDGRSLHAAKAGDHASVRDELLADIVRRQPLLAAINATVAVLFAAAFLGAAPVWVLAAWLAYMVLAQAARLILWWRWRRHAAAGRPARAAAGWLVAASGAAGIGWGLIGPLFAGLGSPAQQMLVPFFLAGMAAGAITALPGYPPAFYAFVAPALLPYAVHLGFADELAARTMGLMTLLYAAGISVVAYQAHGSLQRSVKLHLENARLIGDLEAARLDALTGLPNRYLFHERLRQALALARRGDARVGLLLLDLDDFKDVNDTLGHPAGDRLLRLLAAQLVGVLRASDTLARLGGDEFAVIQPALGMPDSAATLAHRLVDTLAAPFPLVGQEVHVTASIGIAVFPDDGADPDELVRRADLALYRAKAEGRGGFRFFEPAMDEAVRGRRRLVRELRRGLERDELALHYQPQLDLRSGRVSGVEALARWSHPERGPVPPGEFVPAAEASGLIRSLGAWVLAEACRQGRAWREEGLALTVAVNISPAQLRHPDALPTVDRALRASGFEPGLLELEITEGLLVELSAAVGTCLAGLAMRGVRLAIDDFGTGYSSLAYLRRLPVQRIKVDRSFVRNIGKDPEDEAVVRAIVHLGHTLGKEVVAEGVETEAQLAFLRRLGCDAAQGFLLGRPQTATNLRRLLAA